MAEQLLIRVAPELKRKLARAATLEGKTSSQVVRDLIEDYVRQRDLPSYIADLWERIGGELTTAGAKRGDIAKAIKTTRRAGSRDAGGR